MIAVRNFSVVGRPAEALPFWDRVCELSARHDRPAGRRRYNTFTQQNPRRLGKRPFLRVSQMREWVDLRLLLALGLPEVIVDLHLQPEVG